MFPIWKLAIVFFCGSLVSGWIITIIDFSTVTPDPRSRELSFGLLGNCIFLTVGMALLMLIFAWALWLHGRYSSRNLYARHPALVFVAGSFFCISFEIADRLFDFSREPAVFISWGYALLYLISMGWLLVTTNTPPEYLRD